MPLQSSLEAASAFDTTTRDGITLHGYTLPARPGAIDGLHIVLAHGLTHHSRRAQLIRIARRLSSYGAVTAFDFRGHGISTGGSSVGGDGELADLDAVLTQVRAAGARTIATLGFSMGGSVALRHAALAPTAPDIVVSVSAVSRWYVRDTTAMRRVHWLLESPIGRAYSARGKGTRLGPRWATDPRAPIDVVEKIAPTPLLLVHGTADRYFGPEHAHALHAATNGHADLWVVEGYGHAEGAMTPVLTDRLGRWIAAVAAEQRQRGQIFELPARGGAA